jgi:hypothetical protein
MKHSGAWPHPLQPHVAGRGSHLLGLSLSGGEVHHQDPLCLKHGLTPWWHVQLNHGSGLLVSELASPWHYLLLGGGLPSVGLCLLPLDERDIARKGGQFLTVAPPLAGEPSS